jgi:hypothetical protein
MSMLQSHSQQGMKSGSSASAGHPLGLVDQLKAKKQRLKEELARIEDALEAVHAVPGLPDALDKVTSAMGSY